MYWNWQDLPDLNERCSLGCLLNFDWRGGGTADHTRTQMRELGFFFKGDKLCLDSIDFFKFSGGI